GVLYCGISDSFELIVIDDGSVDGTRELLRERAWPSHVKLFFHERNLGKGVALRTGLAEAKGEFRDGDGRRPPVLALRYLSVARSAASAACRRRLRCARAFKSHSAFSFWYVVGNRAVRLFADLVFNSWVSDI